MVCAFDSAAAPNCGSDTIVCSASRTSRCCPHAVSVTRPLRWWRTPYRTVHARRGPLRKGGVSRGGLVQDLLRVGDHLDVAGAVGHVGDVEVLAVMHRSPSGLPLAPAVWHAVRR